MLRSFTRYITPTTIQSRRFFTTTLSDDHTCFDLRSMKDSVKSEQFCSGIQQRVLYVSHFTDPHINLALQHALSEHYRALLCLTGKRTKSRMPHLFMAKNDTSIIIPRQASVPELLQYNNTTAPIIIRAIHDAQFVGERTLAHTSHIYQDLGCSHFAIMQHQSPVLKRAADALLLLAMANTLGIKTSQFPAKPLRQLQMIRLQYNKYEMMHGIIRIEKSVDDHIKCTKTTPPHLVLNQLKQSSCEPPVTVSKFEWTLFNLFNPDQCVHFTCLQAMKHFPWSSSAIYSELLEDITRMKSKEFIYNPSR